MIGFCSVDLSWNESLDICELEFLNYMESVQYMRVDQSRMNFFHASCADSRFVIFVFKFFTEMFFACLVFMLFFNLLFYD